MNNVQLIGNLGGDPEIRAFSDTKKAAFMSLAVNEPYKDRDGNLQDRTTWINLVIWTPGLVGVAEKYLRKGAKIAIGGKIQVNTWEDKEGNKRTSTVVSVRELHFLDKKEGGAIKPNDNFDRHPGYPEDRDPEDDLPF